MSIKNWFPKTKYEGVEYEDAAWARELTEDIGKAVYGPDW